jgi:hypothetical protein
MKTIILHLIMVLVSQEPINKKAAPIAPDQLMQQFMQRAMAGEKRIVPENPVQPALNSIRPLPTAAVTPTLIPLNYQKQTFSAIIMSLNRLTKGMVQLPGGMDTIGQTRQFSLVSPAPVPFWEAIDRLSEMTLIQRAVVQFDIQNQVQNHVQFFGQSLPELDYGPVTYTGPYRLGPVTIREEYRKNFRKKDQNKLAISAEQPNFRAIISLAAEPNLISIQTGHLKNLVAIDNIGQSLLDTRLQGNGPFLTSDITEYLDPKNVRIPLVRATKTSQSLALLKGVIPLEVARKPETPALTIKLNEAIGKTYRVDDLSLTLSEYKTNAQGPASLKLIIRIEGKRGDNKNSQETGLRAARIMAVYRNLIELTDAQNRRIPIHGIQSQNDNSMTLSHRYFVSATNPNIPLPHQIKVYKAEWTDWTLPFEFRDLPLP